MPSANVLITSASAKVLLVQAFREAAHALGGRVLTADLPDAPCAAAHFADAHIVLPPTRNEAAFAQALQDACREHDVGLVVPTRDAELPLMAHLKDALAADPGAHVLVSEHTAIQTCQDKRRFHAFCQAHDIPTLPLLSEEEAVSSLPVFIRPRCGGAAGRGARRVGTAEELRATLAATDCVITPFVEAPEYSVDILQTLDGGQCLGMGIRKRECVRAGEAHCGTLVQHDTIAQVARRLASALRLSGHCNMQFFDHPQRGVLAIEVNARFGGASNLAIRAGLASPARILRMVLHPEETPRPAEVRTGWSMLRYVQDVIRDDKGRVM